MIDFMVGFSICSSILYTSGCITLFMEGHCRDRWKSIRKGILTLPLFLFLLVRPIVALYVFFTQPFALFKERLPTAFKELREEQAQVRCELASEKEKSAKQAGMLSAPPDKSGWLSD
jgi:hypothetical protein